MRKIFPILLFAVLAFVACDNDDRRVEVNNTMRNFIEQKYDGAEILYAETEDRGMIDVDITHDGIHKDVYFDKKNNWVYTSWDVMLDEVPAAAVEAVENKYPSYIIADVDYIERPSGISYKFDIEKGEWDREVYVTPEGIIID